VDHFHRIVGKQLGEVVVRARDAEAPSALTPALGAGAEHAPDLDADSAQCLRVDGADEAGADDGGTHLAQAPGHGTLLTEPNIPAAGRRVRSRSGYDRRMTAEKSLTNRNTIVVPGVGRITIEPDIATIRLGVLLVRSTAAAAREAAAATMSAVLEAIERAGVARRDVQTSLLNLSPVTDYSPETGPRVTGYQVANSVAVTVRDLAAAGSVVDAGLGAGATSMDGLEFRLDNSTEAEDAARRAAVEDARRRAQTLASAAGVTLGDVVAIEEGERHGPPMPYGSGTRAMALKSEAADTPVESGTDELAVSVLVAFAIG
jgi:uncharacterized protein YggE